MTRLSTLIALTALLGTALASPARADVMTQLNEGKILARSADSTEPIKPGVAMALVNAPPELVWKVIMDVDRYKDFVPKMVGSKTLKRGKLYLLESSMPWPANDNWVHVKVNKGKRGKTRIVAWGQDRGTFRRFEGVAWIQPAGKGRSVLTYQVLALPRVPAPDALWTRGMKVIAKEMVDAIRDRAHDVFAGKVAVGDRVASQ